MEFLGTTAIAKFITYVYRPPQTNTDTNLTFIFSGNGFIPLHETASASKIRYEISADELSLW